MEFGKSFTYIFEDQNWIVKILVVSLIALIPIVGPFYLAGWGVEITRRVINRDPEPLADYSDFVNYLIKGLVVTLIGFVYMLPVILVQSCAGGLVFAGTDAGDETLMMVANIVMACFGCLTFIYAMLMGLVLPAAIGNYAATGELGAAFRFGDIFAHVKAAPAAYLMVLVGSLLAGFIAMLGLIACVIGVFFTVTIAYAINSHLAGQAYYEAELILGGRSDELQDTVLGSM